MRVAYLVSQYPAPSHTFIRREVQALRAQGVDIRMYSIRQPASVEVMSEVDQRDRDETFYVFPPRVGLTLRANWNMLKQDPRRYFAALWASLGHRYPGVKHFFYSGLYFLEGMILAEEFQAQGIEHLHGHFANAASHVALAAATYTGVGWSMTLHGLDDFDYPGGPLLRKKLQRASFVACVTKYGRAQAMRLSNPDDWSKLFIARCGIELDKLPAIPERTADAAERRLRFICVSRLSPEKGLIGLLEAFAEATEKGLDADLVMVGDGRDRYLVENKIRALKLKDRVQLKGRLPEDRTLQEIAESDLLVLSSFMEGLPVVLMEALALEVPVIAPTIAGIPELVEHGETGYLFVASDWSALADRMIDMANDPEGRRRMGKNGRARILEEFDVAEAVAPLKERFGTIRVVDAGAAAPTAAIAARSADDDDEAETVASPDTATSAEVTDETAKKASDDDAPAASR